MALKSQRHQASHASGLEAEWLAAAFLRLKGYRIVATRFAAAGGEIDLIARRFGTLAFVEVKARAEMEAARVAISAGKLRRIERAARVYLARLSCQPKLIRIDAVFIAPNALPRHEKAVAELSLD